MDEKDREDIITKVNTAGNNDDDSENSDFDSTDRTPDNNDGSNDGGNDEFGGDAEFGNDNDEEDLEEVQIYENESLFLEEPVKCNMFHPGSNDILDETLNEGLINQKKNSIFEKRYLKSKLQESFNQEEEMKNNEEPLTAPAPVVKPDVKPDVAPSRRNKPFLPMPEVQPDPKAKNE